MLRVCRTCCYWGKSPYMGHMVAWAKCSHPCVPIGPETTQDDTCKAWDERQGEELALGLGRVWRLRLDDKFLPAGIIHDLRYEEGTMTYAERDSEFLKNCLKLSSSAWDVARAYTLYGIVRIYSFTKE
jgi:hypothetical protein